MGEASSMKQKTVSGTEIENGQVLFSDEITEIKEIRPRPQGKVKLRIRPGEFPTVFVSFNGTCSRHYIADVGTHWELLEAHEINRVL